jgi:hypothetical protein
MKCVGMPLDEALSEPASLALTNGGLRVPLGVASSHVATGDSGAVLAPTRLPHLAARSSRASHLHYL